MHHQHRVYPILLPRRKASYNEIAPGGTTSVSVCGGGPYIEILNDAFSGLN